MQAVEVMNSQLTPFGSESVPENKLNFRNINEWLNSAGSSIQLYEQQSQGREEVEAFIAKQYNRVYQANINHFMPQLIALKCKDRLSTAVGIKNARLKPLFIEQYLDNPVEHEIEVHSQEVIERRDIVEVGNLAASWKGTSQLVMVMLPVILERAGYKWGIFTATGQVERLIRKLCLEPITLCEASEARVNNEGDVWGDYYQQSTPHVFAGSLKGIEQRLSQHRLLRHILKFFGTQIDEIVAQIELTK